MGFVDENFVAPGAFAHASVWGHRLAGVHDVVVVWTSSKLLNSLPVPTSFLHFETVQFPSPARMCRGAGERSADCENPFSLAAICCTLFNSDEREMGPQIALSGEELYSILMSSKCEVLRDRNLFKKGSLLCLPGPAFINLYILCMCRHWRFNCCLLWKLLNGI